MSSRGGAPGCRYAYRSAAPGLDENERLAADRDDHAGNREEDQKAKEKIGKPGEDGIGADEPFGLPFAMACRARCLPRRTGYPVDETREIGQVGALIALTAYEWARPSYKFHIDLPAGI